MKESETSNTNYLQPKRLAVTSLLVCIAMFLQHISLGFDKGVLIWPFIWFAIFNIGAELAGFAFVRFKSSKNSSELG